MYITSILLSVELNVGLLTYFTTVKALAQSIVWNKVTQKAA